MCIICVSKPGVRQPDENTIRTMFYRNPHGAGYMFARDGRVEIRKGFMRLDEYLRAIREERFTAADSVVYHFRISTQAGVNPEMTHPFPLSNQPARLRRLDQSCRIGVAHNGVIRLTSDPDNEGTIPSAAREFDLAHGVIDIFFTQRAFAFQVFKDALKLF